MLIGTMMVIHVATCNEQNGKLTSKGAHESNKHGLENKFWIREKKRRRQTTRKQNYLIL
jgi:hypothetical protein